MENKIDLRACKHDDLLRLRCGLLGRYVRHNPGDFFPHVIEFTSFATRHKYLDNGFFYVHGDDDPNALDVVEIVGQPCEEMKKIVDAALASSGIPKRFYYGNGETK